MISFRTVQPADLEALLKLEENWPENERASPKQLLSRIRRFPQGFLVCIDTDSPEEIIASATSCPVVYDNDHPELISTWNHASCNGCCPENASSMETDTLYLVSSVICKSRQGGGIYRKLLTELSVQAKRQGFMRILTGAIIPGYKSFCQKHGVIPASKYAMMQRNGRPLDQLLRILSASQFYLPNEEHVIPDYYPDEGSMYYAALLVRDLQE